jgi:ABC-type multidrug transport system fused ATPase/permease subunit
LDYSGEKRKKQQINNMPDSKENILARSVRISRQMLSLEQKRKFLLLVVLSVITSFLEVFGLASLVPVVVVCADPSKMLTNKYFRAVYDGMHFQSSNSFILTLLLSIIVFFIVKAVFTTWVNYIQGRFTADVANAVMMRQLRKHQTITYQTFADLGSGQLVNSNLSVPNSFLHSIIRPLITMGTELVVTIIILVGLVLYNPLLILILVVMLVPPMMLTYRAVRGRTQYIQTRMHALWSKSVRHLNELSIGFIELRLARRYDYVIDNVAQTQGEAFRLEANSFMYNSIPAKVIELAAVIGVIAIMLYSIVISGDTDGLVALIGLFAAAAYRLMPSLNRLLGSIVIIRSNQIVLDDIEALRGLDAQEPHYELQQPLVFEKSLVFKQLAFSFKGAEQPALDDINLQIRKGEKVGFIGTSGSGKTTLMNILLRFYKEQQGQILVDGVALGPENIDGWHRIIGYVKQDTFLMDASIQDNITLGENEPDPQRLAYAVEMASLKSFVDSLPEGVHSHIGERGSRLSGGQRQRIGIARALYKKTQILVLDEATSALDNETEREVNEAINHLSSSNLTILIVAHRLTTLRECNRIYELNQGKLIAEHQYSDLMSRIH